MERKGTEWFELVGCIGTLRGVADALSGRQGYLSQSIQRWLGDQVSEVARKMEEALLGEESEGK